MSAKPKISWKDIMLAQEAKNSAEHLSPAEKAIHNPRKWYADLPEAPVQEMPIFVPKQHEPKQWSNPAVPPPGFQEIKEQPLNLAVERKGMKWEHKTTTEEAKKKLEEVLSKGTISTQPPVPEETRKGRGQKAKTGQEEKSGNGGRQ